MRGVDSHFDVRAQPDKDQVWPARLLARSLTLVLLAAGAAASVVKLQTRPNEIVVLTSPPRTALYNVL
jgi:hypothetical protein